MSLKKKHPGINFGNGGVTSVTGYPADSNYKLWKILKQIKTTI